MRFLLLVATFAGWTAPLASQQGSLLQPGRRVWIRTPNSSGGLTAGFKGTLEAVAGDTLLVRPHSGAPVVSVSPDGQARVFISRGRRSSPVLGAAIGAGLGVALGAFSLAFRQDSVTTCVFFSCSTVYPHSDAKAIAIAGAAAGAVAGAIWALHETWSPVEALAGIRPTVFPMSGGLALGLTITH